MGAGESGTGSAILASVKGFDVFVSDTGRIKDKYKKMLADRNISYEEGCHTEEKIFSADIIIKSPGIPDNSALITSLRERDMSVVSEIEFTGRYTSAYTICISGSNGKTTTTNLIYHILKNAGLNVGMAGNVGDSFALQVAEDTKDIYVIELSSFQLDGMCDFRADVAILMNITPDHLDRYDNDFQNYIASKFRLIQNQGPDDYFIYWADDPIISKELAGRKTSGRELLMKQLPFSDSMTDGMAAFVENNKISIFLDNKTEQIMTMHDLALKGRHNTFNSMAAALTGKILNIRNESIRNSLSDFQGVEHRLENVISVHGINFINDSKATNVNSTWYALECMTTDLVWIAGGVDKGNDYSELFDLAKDKIKAIVCLGKENEKIKAAFSDIVPTIVETQSMNEAVKSAYYLASSGDTVLLSPACASFDLFDNYEDRGRQFKNEVRNL